jgi:hypothetical protein
LKGNADIAVTQTVTAQISFHPSISEEETIGDEIYGNYIL